MKRYEYPQTAEWTALTERPQISSEKLNETISNIFQTVDIMGDAAVRGFTKQFDNVEVQETRVTTTEIEKAREQVSPELIKAIQLAIQNIERFHLSQREETQTIETMPGVNCWRESRPIERVGLYIPGGSAPLFSTVLMLGVPAKIAGCKEIVLCTPPQPDGSINPAILVAAELIGIKAIFKIGGIQAIAAMTYGTEQVPSVHKIFGPGNQYVTAAKEYALRKGIAIDMPAGPSEVLIIADDSANASFVAADLLSQAEHGADSQVILLSTSTDLINQVDDELEKQLSLLPRKDTAQKALENSRSITLKTMVDCMKFSNIYAPEHLIIATENAVQLATTVSSAGSVFIGNYSCESAGDYASGTNHTLPTNGYARGYSGVSLDSFVKKITFQELTAQGIQNIGPAIEIMAEAEGLFAHKNAVSLRLKTLNND